MLKSCMTGLRNPRFRRNVIIFHQHAFLYTYDRPKKGLFIGLRLHVSRNQFLGAQGVELVM